MTTKEFKPVFPLEDDYQAKVTQNPDDKFWRLKEGHNGIFIKAPFDCKVKELKNDPEQESYFGTDYYPGYQTRYPSYHVVYESVDGNHLFSIYGILPNDKSKNKGAKFKKGENIGRTLSKDSGTSFIYYDTSTAAVVDGELVQEATPVEEGDINHEIQGEPKEPRTLSTFTLVKVVGVVVALAFAFKLVKGK